VGQLAYATKKAEDEFYNNLINYVRGEPNCISPGTIWMTRAKIAKTLVEHDPSLMASEKRNALIEAVDAIYHRDHSVVITLPEKDVAMADLSAALTDDLSKA